MDGIPFQIPEDLPCVTGSGVQDDASRGQVGNAAAHAATWEAQQGLHGVPDDISPGHPGATRAARLAVRRHVLSALGYVFLAEHTGADDQQLLVAWDAIRIAAGEAARPSGDLPCCTLLACSSGLARARIASLKQGRPADGHVLSWDDKPGHRAA